MILKHFLKMVSFILFFFIISSISFSQIKLGLNGGVDIASYTLSNKAPETTLMNKTGLSIGGIVDYPIIDKLTIRLNVKYNQRGGENTIAVFGNVQNKIYFDYIELAPYVIYRLVDSEILAKAIGGISYGHLVNAKIKSGNNEFGVKEDFNLSNITADFGLEVEIPVIEKVSLIANGIYSLGLKDISKADGEIKTKDIQICVGILYSIL
jgi:hypothetical protein